jgi:hypothetical protein
MRNLAITTRTHETLPDVPPSRELASTSSPSAARGWPSLPVPTEECADQAEAIARPSRSSLYRRDGDQGLIIRVIAARSTNAFIQQRFDFVRRVLEHLGTLEDAPARRPSHRPSSGAS